MCVYKEDHSQSDFTQIPKFVNDLNRCKPEEVHGDDAEPAEEGPMVECSKSCRNNFRILEDAAALVLDAVGGGLGEEGVELVVGPVDGNEEGEEDGHHLWRTNSKQMMQELHNAPVLSAVVLLPGGGGGIGGWSAFGGGCPCGGGGGLK